MAKLLFPGRGCCAACDVQILLRLCQTCHEDLLFFRPALVEALVFSLEHGDPDSWCSALRALGALADPASERVLESLARCLTGPEKWLRPHVVFAFTELARRGGAAAITVASISIFKQPDVDIRCSVLKLLEQAAKFGEPAASMEIARALEDENADVRRTAISMLAELTGHSHAKQLSMITQQVASYLEHENLSVRDAAMSALTCIAVVANTAVIAAVASRLKHRDSGVRRTAVQVLQLLSFESPDEISSVLACLEHSDPEVRCSALQALGELVDTGKQQIEVALLPLLDDVDESVRTLASKMLERLSCQRARRLKRKCRATSRASAELIPAPVLS